MRLFLSSYRLGGDPRLLTALCPPPCAVGVIGNAADSWPSAAREWAIRSEFEALAPLGYQPEEIDLRSLAGCTSSEAHNRLQGYPLIWVRGGNTFVLRARLAQSGTDAALCSLVSSGKITYGGYSAGACVLAPSLAGLDTLDDPDECTRVCGVEPIWRGLGLIDFAIVPHYQSPGHESPDAISALVERYERGGVPCRALRDGEVITVNDD